MPQDVYVSTLRRAVELHDGSTQALASLLRAPEATLLRWMAGQAMMPIQAFSKLVDVVMECEARRPATSPPMPADARDSLSFRAARLLARCAKCGGTEFVADTAMPPRFADPLSCSSCGKQVVHGRLITELVEGVRSRVRSRARKTTTPRRD